MGGLSILVQMMSQSLVQNLHNLLRLIHNQRECLIVVRGLYDNPDRYLFLGESFDKVHDELHTNPCNYNEEIQDKNAEFWQKAVMFEMELMYSNQVWDLVEPPEVIKPIGCKWICKKKEE